VQPLAVCGNGKVKKVADVKSVGWNWLGASNTS
jgi:hypothetical protein